MDWAEEQKQLRAQKRVARLTAILGALFLSIAAWQAVETIVELHRGLTTRGTVVGIEKTGQGKRRHDFPCIEFRDRADPSRPAYASIDSLYENWKFPVLPGSLGAVFLFMSVHRLRRRR